MKLGTKATKFIWGQSVQDSSKKMKSFLDSPVRRGSGIVYGQSVAMIRVWTQLFDMDIKATNTMYKSVLF